MRTRLIFVRHGESVHQLEGIVGGPRGCRGLTALGHEQAHHLANRLTGEVAADGPVAVYSSVLRRAVETAQP
ncbi:histidine phosphatase family protein, partial [Micromonospora sp. M51]